MPNTAINLPAISRQPRRSSKTLLTWALLIVVVCGVRIFLPFTETDSMLVYEKIAAALLQGDNWGKQALVGALDYPPLPTVVLIFFVALTPSALDPGHLMVALCQVTVLVFLLRSAATFSLRSTLLAGLLMMAGLMAGPQLWAANPFWVMLVPLAAAMFYFCQWERAGKLRSLVMVAICAGTLVYCGIAGMIAGLLLVLTLRRSGIRRKEWPAGSTPLAIAPWIYGMILYPLFNLLILGDLGYAMKRLAGSLSELGPDVIYSLPQLWLLAVVALVLGLAGRLVPRFHLACGWIVAFSLLAVLHRSSSWFVGGGALFMGFAALPLLHILFFPGKLFQRLSSGVTVAATCVLLFAGTFIGRQPAATGAEFANGAPPAEEVVALVDAHWPNSRILLLDLRSAAIYADSIPNRFSPRLDVIESDIRLQIEEEQMHLLLAPNNGVFYARHGQLAEMHTNDRDWLFLEKQWPDGWQLWRCVRAAPQPNAELATTP
ncbi:MAG: hypothetical protein ACI8W8_005007 [Rhodothermales bacterium]|jgi:hypothetical protein